MRKVEIFDSTLRDGSQAEGISFSLSDKIRIVHLLDELGVDYIEAGNPGSNPKDIAFFEEVSKLPLRIAELVAFGSTRRPNAKAEEDANLNSIISSGVSVAAIFGKSWDFHVTDVLRVSLDENLRMIKDSISYLVSKGIKVFFDAEHYFDGYKNNKEYALETLKTALDAGADTLVLCETRGGVLPLEVYNIVLETKKLFPTARLAIHAHDDSGCAVASSIMAVQAGCEQVQGTLIGFGERCGNANLSTIIADIELKLGYRCISSSLSILFEKCMTLSSICNINIPSGMPYIGSGAFAHKGGMHIDGVLKNSKTFEHENPAFVGATRRLIMSEVAGRALLMDRLSKIIPDLKKESEEAKRLIALLKEKESEGYQYEGAEASFELLVRRSLNSYQNFFSLVHYQTTGLKPYADPTSGATHSAVVKVSVYGESAIAAAEGQGPVNALDMALRKVLENFYPSLRRVFLTDYKVRALEGDGATASRVRVVIDSSDGVKKWSTTGVSTDIIEASWIALADSIEYKLIQDRRR